MKKFKYFSSILLFGLVAAAVSLIFLFEINTEYSTANAKENLGENVVTLERVVRLSEAVKENPENDEYRNDLNKEVSKINISDTVNKLYGKSLINKMNFIVLLLLFLNLAFILFFYFYLYRKILRPFGRLEKFASAVAAGNLDFPLEVERGNAFGAFSWAFDMLRTELRKTKKSEQEAVAAKKTLVATISHDIKTPVASIRAYAEAIASGMAKTPERKKKYLNTIISKADEVAQLTDDLFLHALSDMDKLSIEKKVYGAKTLIPEIMAPFFAQYGDRIKQKNEVPDISVITDARRISQVFENIITNASKYAGDSEIHIDFSEKDGFLVCSFEDFGGGILPEDLPFIFDKFFRGKNSEGKKGSGLGLYIVKYIMDKTGGYSTLENTKSGLLIKIGIKTCAI